MLEQDNSQIIKNLRSKFSRLNNEIVFIGRCHGEFIDNVKYSFLSFTKENKGFNASFLTYSKKTHSELIANNLNSVLFPEEDAVQACLQAGVVVCDDFWWREHSDVGLMLEGAKVFQLWHGIPLKSIGYPEAESAVNMTPEKADYIRRSYSGYEAVLSTSAYTTEHAFSRAFRASAFPELGYPRNDILSRPPLRHEMINVDVQLYAEIRQWRKQGGKVVFYMPTFRDNPGHMGGAHPPLPADLNDRCAAQGILFVCKLHPYLEAKSMALGSHVRVCRSTSDSYPLLAMADVLVTDYSSIYFDYLHTGKPIVFYQHDLEQYTASCREFMLHGDDFYPGELVNEASGLLDAVQRALDAPEAYAAARNTLAGKCFGHLDSEAGPRVARYIENELAGPARFAEGRKAPSESSTSGTIAAAR